MPGLEQFFQSSSSAWLVDKKEMQKNPVTMGKPRAYRLRIGGVTASVTSNVSHRTRPLALPVLAAIPESSYHACQSMAAAHRAASVVERQPTRNNSALGQCPRND